MEPRKLASRKGDERKHDLILLDVMLPKMSGLEGCQHLRADDVNTPIIMLSARGKSSDAAFGLKLGSDDYIAKPFDVGELVTRIDVVLRRSGNGIDGDRTESFAVIQLDFLRLEAKRGGKPIDVTPKEFEKFCNFSLNTQARLLPENSSLITFGSNALHFTRARLMLILIVSNKKSF